MAEREALKKSAIVTGGSSGIGAATARQLAVLGYRVAVIARGVDKLQAVARDLGAVAIPADVADAKSLTAAIETAHRAFGRIDVLVNNAGHAPLKPTADFTPDEWEKILATNLSSVFHATRAVWPVMTRQGGGAIVNVSSMSSIDPFAGLGAYGAAKAGVNLLTLATAREGAPLNIRVYCVAPGAVDTPMLRSVVGEAAGTLEKLRPEDVADVIVRMAEGQGQSGEVRYLRPGQAGPTQ